VRALAKKFPVVSQDLVPGGGSRAAIFSIDRTHYAGISRRVSITILSVNRVEAWREIPRQKARACARARARAQALPENTTKITGIG